MNQQQFLTKIKEIQKQYSINYQDILDLVEHGRRLLENSKKKLETLNSMLTPEQRSENARKAWANRTIQERAKIFKKIWESRKNNL